MSEYTTPHRAPDEVLFATDLPDWQKLLWLTIRKFQGRNDWAYATATQYAEALGKKLPQISRGIRNLIDCGYLEKEGKKLRCTVPGVNCESTPDTEKVNPESTCKGENVNCESTDVNCESTDVNCESTDVNCESTPLYKDKSNIKSKVKSGNKSDARAKKKSKPIPKKKPTPIPDWINPDTWSDWEQFRREKRQPLKPTTVTYQLKQLEKFRTNGHDPNAIIERSIANGWTGLFEPDTRASGSSAHPARAGTASGSTGGGRGQAPGRGNHAQGSHPGNPGTPGTTGSERAGMRGPNYAIELVNRAISNLPPRADEAESPGPD